MFQAKLEIFLERIFQEMEYTLAKKAEYIENVITFKCLPK